MTEVNQRAVADVITNFWGKTLLEFFAFSTETCEVCEAVLEGMTFGKSLQVGVKSWAVGDYCVSLKVLKSPHKEIY